MIDRKEFSTHAVAHIPDLFLRAIKSASAKGGIVVGERSPLLPWIAVAPMEANADDPLPDTSGPDSAPPSPIEPCAPLWLQVAFKSVVIDGANVPSTFALRTISHVGFGFGNSRPW